MEEKIIKRRTILKCFSFKTINSSGGNCKVYVNVYPNGISTIIVRMFIDPGQVLGTGSKSIRSFFGKELHQQEMNLKFTTLNAIHYHVAKSLHEKQIPIKDII